MAITFCSFFHQEVESFPIRNLGWPHNLFQQIKHGRSGTMRVLEPGPQGALHLLLSNSCYHLGKPGPTYWMTRAHVEGEAQWAANTKKVKEASLNPLAITAAVWLQPHKWAWARPAEEPHRKLTVMRSNKLLQFQTTENVRESVKQQYTTLQ